MIDSHLGVTTDVDLTPGGVNLEAGPVATIDTHSAILAVLGEVEEIMPVVPDAETCPKFHPQSTVPHPSTAPPSNRSARTVGLVSWSVSASSVQHDLVGATHVG